MKKQILFILAFLLTAGLWSASAQDKFQVRGTVLDENGESVIGAGVMEKGTTNGAITDIDGKYVLTVSSANAVLEVSFVGYITEIAPVGGRAVIDFTLKEDSTVLDEVMVIGYGTVKKKDLTGSVANVDGTKIANMQSMSVRLSRVRCPALRLRVPAASRAPAPPSASAVSPPSTIPPRSWLSTESRWVA